jgi:hypothetical protein
VRVGVEKALAEDLKVVRVEELPRSRQPPISSRTRRRAVESRSCTLGTPSRRYGFRMRLTFSMFAAS